MRGQLSSLIRSKASSQDLQACYSPFFKELARIVIGRDDIPVPSTLDDARRIRRLWSPYSSVDVEGEEDDIEELTDYITTEGEKRRQQEQQKYELGPNIRPAVKAAWKTDYVGNADDLLQGAVDSMFIGSRDKDYANFCAIIQGSGTGKSRLVDKLAESVFTIPIILRPSEDESGFPLGDVADGRPLVNNFFCVTFDVSGSSPLDVQRRFLKFLLKIITFVNNWIDDRKLRPGAKHMAADWREYLGASQSSPRSEMYAKAIDPSPLEGFEDILNSSKLGADELQKRGSPMFGNGTYEVAHAHFLSDEIY
ncbi:hypothetical protein C0995_015397 [Termitomyces sp. Mi166|nr:hypothetical protein C0995_015397 [Termitomyces sp. Mi166\